MDQYSLLPSLKRPRYSIDDSQGDLDVSSSSSSVQGQNQLFNTYFQSAPHLALEDSSGGSSQDSSPGYPCLPTYPLSAFTTSNLFTSGLDGNVSFGSGSEHEGMNVDPLLGSSTSNSEGGEARSIVKVKKRNIKPREVPPGALLTEKSCFRCRERKVKCDRLYPKCKNCKERNEICDLEQLLPKEKPKVSSVDAARIAALEKRLAELEAQNDENTNNLAISNLMADSGPSTPNGLAALIFANAFSKNASSLSGGSPDSAGSSPKANIGHRSLDWRLATPQMATSLSLHLCDAFFNSCCFVLPTYSYFRTKIRNQRLNPENLDTFHKVAIAAFSAVGTRTSPHSALLGIASDPGDSVDHPEAPLLSAGQRRQNACIKMMNRAYQVAFEEGVEDEPKIENLASLLAVMQLAAFVELEPKKARTCLRAALGHFRDLQDAALSEQERNEIKGQFAFSLYVADSALAATSKKACLITDYDLQAYFTNASIIIPNLPTVQLTPLLTRLLSTGFPSDQSLKTAMHLITCWVSACQRMFVKLVCPGAKSAEDLRSRVPILWAAVDETRAALQYLQLVVTSSGLRPSAHHHDHGSSHSHDADYVALAKRADRDLLDIGSLVHVYLLEKGKTYPLAALLPESTLRVRKGLRALAFYFKMYLDGADLHMVFHAFFNAEYNPQWTKMALQRVGDPDGPLSEADEVSEVELGWFIEGLQKACFYSPMAEKRLAELQPRFSSITESTTVPPPSLSSPFRDFLAADFELSGSFTSPTLNHGFSTGFLPSEYTGMGGFFDPKSATPDLDLFNSSNAFQDPWQLLPA